MYEQVKEILKIADPILALVFWIWFTVAVWRIWANVATAARHVKAIREYMETQVWR